MISYFTRNKGKRDIKICEDSLTASVFDSLKYLPTSMFWEILQSSLYQKKLPTVSGQLLDVIFWDKWNASGTTNSKYVEPDVLLRFTEFDVIIEAKRYDKNQQYTQQMENQIQGYYNEFAEDDKDLFYIMLGGLHSTKNQDNYKLSIKLESGLPLVKDVIICKTDWTKLLTVVDNYSKKIKKTNLPTTDSYTRILDDCISGFGLHQYYKKEWLSEIQYSLNINEKSLKNHFNYSLKTK